MIDIYKIYHLRPRKSKLVGGMRRDKLPKTKKVSFWTICRSSCQPMSHPRSGQFFLSSPNPIASKDHLICVWKCFGSILANLLYELQHSVFPTSSFAEVWIHLSESVYFNSTTWFYSTKHGLPHCLCSEEAAFSSPILPAGPVRGVVLVLT